MARRSDRPFSRRRRRPGTPRHSAPSRITPATPEMARSATPNDASRPGPPPVYKKKKRRLDRKARLLRTFVVFAAVLLVLAGSGYGYLRYRLDQVKTQK